MTLLIVLLTLVVALQTVLVVGLLRSHATILRRLHELGRGLEPAQDGAAPTEDLPALPQVAAVPRGNLLGADLTGLGPDGEAVGIRVVGTSHDTVLAFLATGCETCRPFWEAVARPGELGLPQGTRLVIVTQGPDAESPDRVARLAPGSVAVVMSGEAWSAYDVPGAPFVVHVDGASGRIRGSGTAATWAQVADLLHLVEADAAFARRAPRWRAAADRERERDIDEALLAARIRPGDPSLYVAAAGGPDEEAEP